MLGAIPPLDQGGSKPVAVVAVVAEQLARWRQDWQQRGVTVVIAGLLFRQQQSDKATLLVACGAQLGLKPAFGPADPSTTPFCSRLAAVRCALRWVASIISRFGAPLLAAKAAKLRAKTPS